MTQLKAETTSKVPNFQSMLFHEILKQGEMLDKKILGKTFDFQVYFLILPLMD